MESALQKTPAPILYFPHGGGPLPLLGDDGHQAMVHFLKTITPRLGKPSAILVISAHWEEEVPTLTSGTSPQLIYDYYGFPEESYEIRYPVPGCPDLADKAFRLLQSRGVPARMNEARGFDHGLFVPLKIMYPEAEIPCIQLSLRADLNPRSHFQLGQALAELRQEDILILGSGFSFHNLRALLSPDSGRDDPQNMAFERWLADTCTHQQYSREERERRLVAWESAPAARYCHPRAEHLLPLHVCAGMADAPAELVFQDKILGKTASAYLW